MNMHDILAQKSPTKKRFYLRNVPLILLIHVHIFRKCLFHHLTCLTVTIGKFINC